MEEKETESQKVDRNPGFMRVKAGRRELLSIRCFEKLNEFRAENCLLGLVRGLSGLGEPEAVSSVAV